MVGGRKEGREGGGWGFSWIWRGLGGYLWRLLGGWLGMWGLGEGCGG